MALETCMLTGLPIALGEPCAGILLTPHVGLADRTRPDGLYRPILPLILGIYDGIGRLYDVRDQEELTTRLLNTDSTELFVKTDRKYTPVDADIEHVIVHAANQSLYLRHEHANGTYQYLPVSLALIKQTALDFAERAVQGGTSMTDILEAARNYLNTRHLALINPDPASHPYIVRLTMLLLFLKKHRKFLLPTPVMTGNETLRFQMDVEFYRWIANTANDIHVRYHRGSTTTALPTDTLPIDLFTAVAGVLVSRLEDDSTDTTITFQDLIAWCESTADATGCRLVPSFQEPETAAWFGMASIFEPIPVSDSKASKWKLNIDALDDMAKNADPEPGLTKNKILRAMGLPSSTNIPLDVLKTLGLTAD